MAAIFAGKAPVIPTTTMTTTGAVPANQPISDGEATDRCKSLRRKMADCPSK